MKNPISISVVIPAHNAEETITRCLDSLKGQQRPADEIVIVDDCSQDQTAQIAQRYGRLIRMDRCRGAGAARNLGSREAHGNVFAFIDSDCVAPSGWLANIEQAMQSEETGAVAGGYTGCTNTSFVGRFAFWELVDRRKKFPDKVRTALSNNLAVRAKLFWEAGAFPETFQGATLEDMILSYRVSRLSVIRWLANNGVVHRFPDTISRYARQQFAFGRDTVAAYAMVPELAHGGTHQGRKIYLETALTGTALLAGLFIHPYFVAAALASIWIMNIPLLSLCCKHESPGFAARAALFIPARDALWGASVLWGAVRLLRSNRSYS